MSPFCTACRSCSCSPSTSGMSFKSVFTYLEACGKVIHQRCLPSPASFERKTITLPSTKAFLSKRGQGCFDAIHAENTGTGIFRRALARSTRKSKL